MNFKKSKEQVVNDAFTAASNTVYSHIGNIKHNLNVPPSQIFQSISNAISWGIREAIESIVEDMYTDEEFEKDIGIRDKT